MGESGREPSLDCRARKCGGDWELVLVVTWDLVMLLQWPCCHFSFKFCLNSYHLCTVRYRQLLPIATYSSFICKWEPEAHPLIYNPDLMCCETLEKGFASENFHNLLRNSVFFQFILTLNLHPFFIFILCVWGWTSLFGMFWTFRFCSLVFVSFLGVKNQNKIAAGEVRQEFWAVPVSVSSQSKNYIVKTHMESGN